MARIGQRERDSLFTLCFVFLFYSISFSSSSTFFFFFFFFFFSPRCLSLWLRSVIGWDLCGHVGFVPLPSSIRQSVRSSIRPPTSSSSSSSFVFKRRHRPVGSYLFFCVARAVTFRLVVRIPPYCCV